MAKTNPVSWLARQARRGITDLPANFNWALGNALRDPASSAGRSIQSAGHKVAAAVAEANPLTEGVGGRVRQVDMALEAPAARVEGSR